MGKTLLLAGLLVALGCSEPGSPPGSAELADAASPPAPTIHWYPGDVESAFAAARRMSKPILLYWGAEWCPPCHQLKATIFKERSFIDRSRLFVPVYLDGDTEGAQRYGERFGVVGYPTMVVLSAAGEEITRIAGGIDMQAYGRVLDAASGQAGSITTLVGAAMRGEPMGVGDCRLLAYYSWVQDNEDLLTAHPGHELFPQLEAACPEEMLVERTRLFVRYLQSLAAITTPVATEVQRGRLTARLLAILNSPNLARADLEFTILEGAETLSLVTAPLSEEREQLAAAGRLVLVDLRQDPALPKRERIYTLAGELRLQRLSSADDAAPTAGLAEEITAMATWADTTTPDPYERQTVINAVANTLVEAGLYAAGRAVLLKERGISKYPFYFTLTLADLETAAGNEGEALRWFREAYAEAEGQATRFQWGFNYLSALLEVTPEDVATIQAASLQVFGELKPNAQSAFYQRTRQRMQELEDRFGQWNADGSRVESLLAIRAGVLEVCAQIPATEPSRTHCESFLDHI